MIVTTTAWRLTFTVLAACFLCAGVKGVYHQEEWPELESMRSSIRQDPKVDFVSTMLSSFGKQELALSEKQQLDIASVAESRLVKLRELEKQLEFNFGYSIDENGFPSSSDAEAEVHERMKREVLNARSRATEILLPFQKERLLEVVCRIFVSRNQPFQEFRHNPNLDKLLQIDRQERKNIDIAIEKAGGEFEAKVQALWIEEHRKLREKLGIGKKELLDALLGDPTPLRYQPLTLPIHLF